MPGQAYLSRCVKTFISPEKLSAVNPEYVDEFTSTLDDTVDPFAAANSDDSPLITEHHILWSLSYSVPVLYFNAWMSGECKDQENQTLNLI